MHIFTGYEHKKTRIEMMPLIDVVFLLLVFFIYTMLSMTVYRGIKVDLPSGYGTEGKPDAFIVTVTDSSEVYVEKELVTIEEAVARAGAAARKDDLPVVVMGDRRSNLGISIELLSGLRHADVESVSFRVRERGRE